MRTLAALATAHGPILVASDLTFPGSTKRPTFALGDSTVIEIPVGTQLSEAEELLIADALRRADGDKEKAARFLGISSRTLYRRAKDVRPEGNGGAGES